MGIFSKGFESKDTFFPSTQRVGGLFNTAREPEPEIVLDEEQYSAVVSTSNRVLVIAGAGSGKTRVLTERVKHLLNTGVAPHNIVAITFTNLAAEEMKERLVDVPGIGDAFIGTIHSFANKVMKLSGDKYQIFSDEIDNDFMSYLIDRYCKSLTIKKYVQYKKLVEKHEMGEVTTYAMTSFLDGAEYTEMKRCKSQDITPHPDNSFQENMGILCERANVITFDELIIRSTEYFKSIGATIEHVLVDEFQDVGNLEFNFVVGLNAVNYFFVGDDFQSIYGFKGSNVNIFMHLVRSGQFTVYFLVKNYRNSKSILEVADRVIHQVSNRIPKGYEQLHDNEGKVYVAPKAKVGDCIAYLKSRGNYGKWFILTRSNKELFDLVRKCREMKVPFVTFKREGLTMNELRGMMNSNRVKILTVHTSKGLEADNVILYGRFPIVCPSYSLNEEERRVMYVGITRARNELYIFN